MIVTSYLKKSEKIVLFLCTIGSEMETWAEELFNEGDIALNYLVDTIASIMVEQAVDASFSVPFDSISQRLRLIHTL